MNKIAEAILEADETTKTDGVVVKGGKKYLQVKDRVSIFRKTFGLDYGIDTNIVVDDGKRIVMKAIVIDANGRQIGSGYAEEQRGRGVNLTSAIENCETSCIGRALSSLALHGGEYASANEMEAVGRKEEAIKQKQIDDKIQEPPQPKEEEKMSCIRFINKLTAELNDISALTHLEAYRAKHKQQLVEYWKESAQNRQVIKNFSVLVKKHETDLKEQ